jgi:hypothetical protein
MASKKQKKSPSIDIKPVRVVGEAKLLPLEQFQPNGWNPNRMTVQMKQSLVHGLRTDGWLASQALLVLGTDDKSVVHNVIIDGEHRWMTALELGFTEGPAVVLDGISVTHAKKLTIALNQKRGEFDDTSLQALLLDIAPDVDRDLLSLDTGLAAGDLARYLDEHSETAAPSRKSSNEADISLDGQENMRVPFTFYVTNEDLEYLMGVFQDPANPRVLRADLLVAMVRAHRAGP